MTPERWARVKAVFHAALEQSAEARPALLSAACRTDGALRGEVDALLSAHARAGTFIDSPAWPTGGMLEGGDDRSPVEPGGRLGPYQIVRLLGAGGMGAVYLANHLALARTAALKVLPRGLGRRHRATLVQEAAAAARLGHPFLATFHELLEVDGVVALVMEYVPGPTLRERLDSRRGPLPIAQAVAIAVCLLEALAHAHAADILHRDIKPENIVVTGERAAKLLDFGAAVGMVAAAEPGAVVGTAGYMSPEQLRGEPLDARSDLFAVGAVLYEMIAGRPAFPGRSRSARRAAVLACVPAPLGARRCPPLLRPIVARALSARPEERFASARAFLEELRTTPFASKTALPDTRARQLRRSLQKGSLDEARELYERAVAANPLDSPALSELAAIHCLRFTFNTDRREVRRALAYCARSLAADAANAQAHVWRGYALSRLDRHQEALAAERRAMKLDPTDFYGPYFGGGELQMLGRRREAVDLFQRAVAIGPGAGTCWLYLGWTQLCLDLHTEARHSLARALALEGQSNSLPGVAGYLGECLRRTRRLEAARAHCLLGLDSVERSDHMYRDSLRAFCLCALGRTALDQAAAEAARAAYGQVLAQMQGRPRALGGGHLVVQALAGLARAGGEAGPLADALRLFRRRQGVNFQYFHGCHDDVTLLELARAALAVGQPRQADRLLARARRAGSLEPFAVNDPRLTGGGRRGRAGR